MQNPIPHRCISPTALGLVTGQATLRKIRYIPLLFVNVMASGTGHAARPETTAALQQLHLVTVHVDWGVRRMVRNG